MISRRLRAYSIAVVTTSLGALALPAAVPRLPVEDFFRDPDVSHMELSPDGQYESFLHDDSGRAAVCTQEVGTKQASFFDLGDHSALGPTAPRTVARYQWIGRNRLLVNTEVWNMQYGVFAANRDGSKVQGVSGLETLPETTGVLVNVNIASSLWAWTTLHAFEDKDCSILMLDQHADEGVGRLYPDVVRVNTMTGTYATVARNPGTVVGWGVDPAGRVRLGLTATDDLRYGLIERPDDHAAWRQLSLPTDMKDPHIIAFGPDERHLYVAALSPQETAAIYLMDLEHPDQRQLVASDPQYDLVLDWPDLTPRFDGNRLDHAFFSHDGHRLLGLRYLREGPQIHWFDPKFAQYQQAIDHAMPHTVNICVNFSQDEKRILYLCFSDRDPGTYCLLDVATKAIHPVAPRMPWIKPAEMAPMYPIQYKARDGVVIHGYLTVPAGAQPRHLPLVVMPHGGPWVRDVWGFDPLVQFLANRGYAVLQMNYRGSIGYGRRLYQLGSREIGGTIQDDIEDGTRWALASGVADPQRVAILGQSYGGYSALFALGHGRGLYRCGISVAGVTDWPELFREHSRPEYKFAQAYWRRTIGDLKSDAPRLKAISPVDFADKIIAPLLIIQGTEDHIVPVDQAHEMIAALKAAGHPPATVFIDGGAHGLVSAVGRRKGFAAIEAFLDAHLGPEPRAGGR